jgi:hypothetical protein
VSNEPNYLKAAQAAGWCLRHLKSLQLSELWSAYDRLHLALGVPMQWQGTATLNTVDIVGQVSFVLRSLDTADAPTAVAACDRHFRRARRNALREDEQNAETLANLIDLHRHDQTTSGLEDQAGRVADLLKLRARMDAERAVLFAAPVRVVKDHFIEIEGRQVRVAIDHASEGTDLQVNALCPECGDDTDWSLTATPDRQFIKCNRCNKLWLLSFGEVR